MQINYVKGDATFPKGEGHKVIVHISNNQGGWGRGFVLAISKRWKEPEQVYRRFAKSGLELGSIQVIKVEPDITVVNMIAQNGYSVGGSNAVHHVALEMCLNRVAMLCSDGNTSIHMPRIGTGLGGSSWEKIEATITKGLANYSGQVTVYDL